MGPTTGQVNPFDPDATVIIPIPTNLDNPEPDSARAAVPSAPSGRMGDTLTQVEPLDDGLDEIRDSEPAPLGVTPADIEQTREQMSGTIAAIGEKLNPHALAEEAKGVAADVTQHAREAVPAIASEIVDHAKEAITEAAAAVVQHVKEALPEVAASAGHHAVSGAVNEAKHAIGGAVGTARGASMSLIERIKSNPIPAAIAGLGLYWLFRGGQNEAVPATRPLAYGPQGMGPQGYGPQGTGSTGRTVGQVVGAAGSRIGDVAGQVQDKAGAVAHGVHDAASSAASHVSDAASGLAHGVQDGAAGLAHGVHDRAQQGTDWFQRTLSQNPLAVVATAVALGTAIGLAFPETDKENALMGETRDTLVQKAKDAAQGVGDKVQTVAHEAMETVKEQAQSQGLTTPVV